MNHNQPGHVYLANCFHLQSFKTFNIEFRNFIPDNGHSVEATSVNLVVIYSVCLTKITMQLPLIFMEKYLQLGI